ncbi:MAG: DivIVA domain-containing protein [Bacillota bacterium]|jgi:cell division initiation protein|nr:DivIVA domain-containing protein [Candidatus Fermentithermobacillaceae bacterium]
MGEEETKVTSTRIPRLTPLDIHNKEFTRSFRGYNEEEVDEFLDLIVAELEWYMRENEELQANIAGLESRINHYKGLEETLKNAIVLAQKAADQIKESATREADAIIEEARRQADIIKEQAEEIRRKAYEEIEEQRQKAMRFKTEMRTLLNSTLEMLDKNVNSITRVLEGDNNRNDWR